MSVINFSALGFYGKNRANYRELWKVFGRDWTYLAAEAVWGVQNVPGRDHGFLKIELTEEQRAAMLPILTRMGFFRALSIRPGFYAELELTGGKYLSMVNVAIDIKRHLDMRDSKDLPKYRFGRIICQFGQRPRTDAQDGTVAEIVSKLSASVLAHPWVQQELEKFGEELFEGPFATEFELGILGFIVAYDGTVLVDKYVRATDTTSLAGIPLRTVESAMLTLPDDTLVLVLNCPAVERLHGPPRPTTDSSTDYRQMYYPPKPEGTIVGVSRPTHGDRVLRDFEARVHARFPGVTVYGISRATPDPMAVLNNAIGEAIWLLQKAHEEWRAEA